MLAAAAGLIWLLAAQAPVAEAPRKGLLENTGKPMRVESACAEDDIRALGLTCSAEHPCPVYLELAQMERSGEKIFLTGNLHTEAVTLASILLATEDGGKTWYEPYERIRSATLDQIQFLDFEAGWAAGQLVQALPRDPFLLLTTDGGKTWRRRPLWEEGKVGAIDHFWFDSRKHGLLWIDRMSRGEGGRHEFYESMTGGESWMLREAGDTPRPKQGSRTPNPDWRLRADAATRSYRIERRAEKWQTVASFLIQAGECREPEVTLPEPPPPPDPKAPETPAAPEEKRPRTPPSLKSKAPPK